MLPLEVRKYLYDIRQACELLHELTAASRWRINKSRFDTWRIEMQDRIAIDPKMHFGRPCVTGTRIPVLNVLELVSEGLAFDTIVHDYYPDLQIEDIRACVLYAMEVVAAEEIHITVQA